MHKNAVGTVVENPFATGAAPNPFATGAPNPFAGAAPNPECATRPAAAPPPPHKRKVEDTYTIGPILGKGAYSVVKEGVVNGSGAKVRGENQQECLTRWLGAMVRWNYLHYKLHLLQVALKMINKERIGQSGNLQKFLNAEVAIMEKIARDIPSKHLVRHGSERLWP